MSGSRIAVLLLIALASTSVAEPVKAKPTQKVFEDIYRNATWGSNTNGRGNSGTGSTAHATLLYRTFLQQFMTDNSVKSVVDAGCGDWEFSQLLDWKGIDYKGFDIVESIVAQNTKKYGKPNILFFAASIVEKDLPPADLLISKHVLQHLSNADVATFLKQLPKYKHVLLINGVDRTTMSAANTDIAAGGYRELDVTKPPFNIPGVKVLSYWDGLHMHQAIYVAGKR
ncbi:MAG: class I SAM-dependent methyltransferase [Kofleriaceae bacterium]